MDQRHPQRSVVSVLSLSLSHSTRERGAGTLRRPTNLRRGRLFIAFCDWNSSNRRSDLRPRRRRRPRLRRPPPPPPPPSIAATLTEPAAAPSSHRRVIFSSPPPPAPPTGGPAPPGRRRSRATAPSAGRTTSAAGPPPPPAPSSRSGDHGAPSDPPQPRTLKIRRLHRHPDLAAGRSAHPPPLPATPLPPLARRRCSASPFPPVW